MTKRVNSERIGVWLVGAYGDISTTVFVGALAVINENTSTTGLTTFQPPFTQLPLADLGQLVFGGCDIRKLSTTAAAERTYHASRSFSHEVLQSTKAQLSAIDSDIWVNECLAWNPADAGSGADTPRLREITEMIRNELRAFRDRHQLNEIIVVNLASAEPRGVHHADRDTAEGFVRLIDSNRKDVITPTMLQAYAAFQEDCAYINFSPGEGADVRGLSEIAAQTGALYHGNDGKTGETLVKTALAPMFAYRNLHVMSWEGFNLLGNDDGRSLSNAANRESKVANKTLVLNSILGYPVHSEVSINYVPSLNDWKTAWDFIHFRGFLDVPMSLQFVWQGCDSILAAPLVLDLVRLTAFSARNNETGPMRHLACFFKNPIGVKEQNLSYQFQMLIQYVDRHVNLARSRSDMHETCL